MRSRAIFSYVLRNHSSLCSDRHLPLLKHVHARHDRIETWRGHVHNSDVVEGPVADGSTHVLEVLGDRLRRARWPISSTGPSAMRVELGAIGDGSKKVDPSPLLKLVVHQRLGRDERLGQTLHASHQSV